MSSGLPTFNTITASSGAYRCESPVDRPETGSASFQKEVDIKRPDTGSASFQVARPATGSASFQTGVEVARPDTGSASFQREITVKNIFERITGESGHVITRPGSASATFALIGQGAPIMRPGSASATFSSKITLEEARAILASLRKAKPDTPSPCGKADTPSPCGKADTMDTDVKLDKSLLESLSTEEYLALMEYVTGVCLAMKRCQDIAFASLLANAEGRMPPVQWVETVTVK